jgi:hypothetical protein
MLQANQAASEPIIVTDYHGVQPKSSFAEIAGDCDYFERTLRFSRTFLWANFGCS